MAPLTVRRGSSRARERFRFVIVAAALGIACPAISTLATAAPARALAGPTPAIAPLSAPQIDQIYNPAPGVHAAPPVHLTRQIAASKAQAFGVVDNVTYHGGAVMQASHNPVPIFWFPPTLQNGAPATPDPNYIPLIEQYFEDIGGSSLNQVASQYYQTVDGPTEFIVNSSHQVLAVIDTSPYPAAGPACRAFHAVNCLEYSHLVAKVLAVSRAHATPRDLDTAYYLFTAPHESSCLGNGCFKADDVSQENFRYCAFHSYLVDANKPVVWAHMPYGAYNAIGANGCSFLAPFPNNRDADIEISVVSHEQLEMTTNPQLSGGWLDSAYQEIADKCAYNYGAFNLDGGRANVQLNGHFYTVQQEWSNAIGDCTQGADPNVPFFDPFDQPGLLSGPSGTFVASSVGTTKEPGEPTPTGKAGGHSTWYSYTPSFNGVIAFDTCGSDFDTLLGVYTGGAVDKLTVRAENDDGTTCGAQSSLSVVVAAGVRYSIEVDGANGSTGTVNLHWLRAPPPNGSFVPGDWSAPTPGGFTGGFMSSVSCPSTSRCAAVDSSGNVITYNGRVWASPLNIDANGGLSSISCAGGSLSFCMAVDDFGNAVTLRSGSWSAPTNIDSAGGLTSVSCVSSGNFCAAVDQHGNALTYNGGSWSAPLPIDPGVVLSSVSCASLNRCIAVGRDGNAFTYTNGNWSAPVFIDPAGPPSSISCSATKACVVVDSNGNALAYDGTSWSAPVSVDPGNSLSSVSCPTLLLCVAVDRDGNGMTYDGATWSLPVNIDPGIPFASVSCPTGRRCIAVDVVGQPFTYYGVLGGSVILPRASALIGNKTIAVRGLGWHLNGDTSVGIYECATRYYSPSTCDLAHATTSTVQTKPASAIGRLKTAHITLAVGVIDSNGDTCGLATSPACFVVVVGDAGDYTSQLLAFDPPTVAVSRTTKIPPNFVETIRARYFPVGDTVRVQQCDSAATPANLSTNCDTATRASGTASVGTGRAVLSMTVLVGSTYSDAAGGSCTLGGVCYIAVEDMTNPAVPALLVPIGLAP